MMTNASIALHQTDLALADLVIAQRNQINTLHDNAKQRCLTLLALQAPVTGDLQVVVAAMHALGHAQRMGSLARHVALIARLKQPNPMIASKVRPVLARMSLLASQLAEDAATALEHQGSVTSATSSPAAQRVSRCSLAQRSPSMCPTSVSIQCSF